MDQLFRQISRLSKEKSVAAAFGIVLYTDEHAHVAKVISDNAYCKALNAISGARWVLFAARGKAGHYGYPKLKPGEIGMMMLMWREPRENERLLNALSMDSTRDLPCLLVLFPDNDGMAHWHKVTIEGKTTAEAYESLKRAVEVVTEAVEGIFTENLKNAEGVHAAVALRLQHEKQWKFIKRAVPFIAWAKQLVA